MNRINQLFAQQQHNLLSVYLTAGYPALNDTVTVIETLSRAGADILEIGIPFSDPLADGPTIQRSSEAALRNGMNMKVLFQQLENIRQTVNIPLIAMGYFNPVMQYGVEKFCQSCAHVGIDGVILPDLPVAEYVAEYKSVFEKYGLINIFLITPQTSDARIRQIDSISDGFIYMVAANSTTGAKQGLLSEQENYFKRIQAMKLRNPVMAGFGISNSEMFEAVCKYANGAIIGSAFVNAVSAQGDLKQNITRFVQSIRPKP